MKFKQRYGCFLLFCCFWLQITFVYGQSHRESPSFCFISDCQEPLTMERFFLRAHNNKEGREMLFRVIAKEKHETVFMLGDLVGSASDDQAWKGVDVFLKELQSNGTKVYAVPGNHEYLFRPKTGIENYKRRFVGQSLTGSCIRLDSMAFLLLNSNLGRLTATENELQLKWYERLMDSLELESSIKIVIIGVHHSPFSNSKVVGCSKVAEEAFLPKFYHSKKAKLIVSGHSHNLEYFKIREGKHCLVIGGGGGIDQPLYTGTAQKQKDLIEQEIKPRFFYLVLQRSSGNLEMVIRGFSRELVPVPEIRLSL